MQRRKVRAHGSDQFLRAGVDSFWRQIYYFVANKTITLLVYDPFGILLYYLE